MNSDHIVKNYDEELGHLDSLLAEMGGLCEVQLSQAIKAMIKRDGDLASIVIERDKEIDELEKTIDELAINLIALRQPMAEDLRIIIAALKVANNLERVGDYAKNICKRSIILSQSVILGSTEYSISRMGNMVQSMIKNVLDAYVERDSERAREVRSSDQDVDRMHSSLFRELLTFMMEDPRNISTCTHLLFIAKNLERIGDHVTSVAEQLIFVVDGETPVKERAKSDQTSSITIEQGSVIVKEEKE